VGVAALLFIFKGAPTTLLEPDEPLTRNRGWCFAADCRDQRAAEISPAPAALADSGRQYFDRPPGERVSAAYTVFRPWAEIGWPWRDAACPAMYSARARMPFGLRCMRGTLTRTGFASGVSARDGATPELFLHCLGAHQHPEAEPTQVKIDPGGANQLMWLHAHRIDLRPRLHSFTLIPWVSAHPLTGEAAKNIARIVITFHKITEQPDRHPA
jgi:hypothetical protein